MRSIQTRKRERGVTILLIAVSLAALLAMAALAIDVVTLYVARTEAQRAADAAALAGARMLAGSGYTSTGPSWNSGDSTPLCQNSGPGAAVAANAQAEAVAAQNQIGGQAAAVKTIACDLTTNPGNPQMTVTVQRVNLPTFFARIWGRTASSVTASSTAEAYNPSGFLVPIQVSGVKPWLVPNCDPDPLNIGEPNFKCGGKSRFVKAADGSITNGGSFIGKTIEFRRINTGTAPAVSNPPAASQFYALDVDPSNPPTLCPSASGPSCGPVGGGDNYIDNIACSSAFKFTCGQTIGGSPIAVLTGVVGTRTREGTQCLIHAELAGPGQGQDVLTPGGGGSPVRIDGGDNNPNLALQGVPNISRSDSIVTVPLYDGGCIGVGPGCSPTTTVVGFLQLGIMQTETGPTRVRAVILNAAGCNSTPSGTPVSGGGISAIPVRLVHQ